MIKVIVGRVYEKHPTLTKALVTIFGPPVLGLGASIALNKPDIEAWIVTGEIIVLIYLGMLGLAMVISMFVTHRMWLRDFYIRNALNINYIKRSKCQKRCQKCKKDRI